MTELSFQKTQTQFASHVRNPDRHPAPAGIEDRRMGIYRDLIYNNIEGFLSSGFPILRKILGDDHWHDLVRDFVSRHQSHTPYFLEISQEFLTYLQEERGQTEAGECDPPFMLELAHYEWVELALDVAEETFPDTDVVITDPLEGHPQVSPLAWCLSYQYPVHKLGPAYQPETPPQQPTFLVVYRNRQDQVRFLEANALTTHLLQLLQADSTLSGRAALLQLANEIKHPDPDTLLEFGQTLMQQLLELDILTAVSPPVDS